LEDRGGRSLRLVDGVLHAFEPDPAAVAVREEACAVADGVDIGRSAREVVHHDAVLAGQARGRRKIVIGAARRNQHEVSRDLLARDQRHAGRPPSPSIPAALRPAGCRRRASVAGVEETRYLLARDPLHHRASA
jgi:hypothetical protein